MSKSAPESVGGDHKNEFSGDVILKDVRLRSRKSSEKRRRRERAEIQMATMRAAAGMISTSDEETDDEDYDPYNHVKKSPKKHILGTLSKATDFVRKNAKKGTQSVKGGLLKTRGGIKKAFKSLKRIGKRIRSDSDESEHSPIQTTKSAPPTPSPLVLTSPILKERVFFPENEKTPEKRKKKSEENETKKNESFWKQNKGFLFQFICGLMCIVAANCLTVFFVEKTWRWNVDPFPLLPSVLFAFGIVLVTSSALSCHDRRRS